MLRVYLNNTEKWGAQVRVTENGNENLNCKWEFKTNYTLACWVGNRVDYGKTFYF